MVALLIGYARVSTDQQDLTAQRDGLQGLGVDPGRIYVDHGLTGTNRERPGLHEALAACRDGDTLVVTKLDRLARSLPDARAIAEDLTVRRVSLSLGGAVYDPNDPVGRLLFKVLAMVAEFESDLIRMRTCEGMRAVLALVGITGMYLRQVKETGVLGLIGYLLFGTGYLVIMSITFVAAYVLPSIAGTDPGYVNDVLAAATGGTATGDIGLLQTASLVSDITYLAGGLVFGIALYRARVLARWAAALLAVGGVVTVTLSVLPDAFYRLLAFPNGIAMVGLGYSLWLTARTETTTLPTAVDSPRLTAAGAE